MKVIEKRVASRMPREGFSFYFGLPTVARLQDGTLALAASGFRHGHMRPWGKSVLFESADEGVFQMSVDPLADAAAERKNKP